LQIASALPYPQWPMPYRPFTGQNCSIAGALGVIGERWTLLVLREVLLGRRRFREIQRGTGAATNILSDRLQTLVERGVVERVTPDDGGGSERVEYRPTQKGIELVPVLLALIEWGDKWECPADGPPRVAVHDRCGHDAHPYLVCSHCGERIEPGEIWMRPGPGADEEQKAEPRLPPVPAA